MNKHLLGALALLLSFFVLTIVGCDSPTGGGGGGSTPKVTVRPLPADFATRKAVAYSGYRDAKFHDDAHTPTIANIKEDLALLDGQGFNLLRVFGSNNQMTKDLLATIDTMHYDIKVQLGIWIAGPKATVDAANQAEISAGVTLANQYPSIVQAVSVGNETMVGWNTFGWATPPADIITYLGQVRPQITQPVTSDDNWAVWANLGSAYPKTSAVLDVVDFVAMHTYPLADSLNSSGATSDPAYWDWQQLGVSDLTKRAAAMMDAAVAKTKKDYLAVKANLAKTGHSTLAIVIGETGWQSSPAGGGKDRIHPVNQKMYTDRLAAWTDGPQQIFTFEAFDEPWKGSDDMWGLWDVNRQPKFALTGTGYLASDAVYYVPPPPKVAVSAATYGVLVESLTEGAVAPTGDWQWAPWDSSPATAGSADGTEAPDEGLHFVTITPLPKVWGWGDFIWLKTGEDLSKFNNGKIHFSIRTLYPGKLEFGFHTNNAKGDALLAVDPANNAFGYKNDGTWAHVAIPVATLIGSSTTVDLTNVDSALTVADRFGNTGKASGFTATTTVDIDNVYWTQN